MRYDELPEWSAKIAAWGADYYRTLRDRPVRARALPGEIARRIPAAPPEQPESMEGIFKDFLRLIPEGMTHWQHPRFFAYFPSNASPASILAEQLANTLSAQCMLWQTSPAATELETMMVDWLRQAFGLPAEFRGVIQDTATTATLCAVLTMREKAMDWRGNDQGLWGERPLRVYASEQNHSSIDKAVRLAGLGQQNLVKIATDARWGMNPDRLVQAIRADRDSGYQPAGVVACFGGTSIGACDSLREILGIARDENLYSHVDAAWAGSALICPEFRRLADGIELADSLVINPHKWLGANFDCSVQFLRSPADQIKTVSIQPTYLQTLEQQEITNYSEWTIPLGRRFRALKLWFLFRAYGIQGLQLRIRNHVKWAGEAAEAIAKLPDVEIVTPPSLSLFTFRWAPPERDPDESTRALLERINADGRIYLTQTRHCGQFVIRFVAGQFETTKADVDTAVAVIDEIASDLRAAYACD